MNISSADLNLLVVFEVLLEERSVSRAARRVGLSQPALSNALRRLRDMFGDRLFIRTGRGMAPTPRALRLAGPVRNGLAHLQAALAGQAVFDPATSTRSFRLAMTDYAEWLLAPDLLRHLNREAPHAQIFLRRVERIFVAPEAELREGGLDAAIGSFPEVSALDAGTHARDLWHDRNVCILRKGHPSLRGPWTAEVFAASPQIGVFYRPEPQGLIDNVLAGYGLRRRLQATAPHFLTVPYVVAGSDLIACVPARLAGRFRRLLPLVVREVPVPLPLFHARLVWHERNNEDPAQRWFREMIAVTSTALAASRTAPA